MGVSSFKPARVTLDTRVIDGSVQECERDGAQRSRERHAVDELSFGFGEKGRQVGEEFMRFPAESHDLPIKGDLIGFALGRQEQGVAVDFKDHKVIDETGLGVKHF